MEFFDVIAFFGWVVRFVGLLVFGIAAGWFTLYAFNNDEGRWQMQIAVFLGIFLFTALLAYYSSAGGLGGFALGLGGGLLYWGMRGGKLPEEDPDEE
ncbi:MAG: hypothetical protein ISR58_05480 [Anaerolineales bacterium]|nr:hypothetical protein [Chloroflexota bacterium]MBL6980626.1 hypothetical protein [Anaerolineales bacterium]